MGSARRVRGRPIPRRRPQIMKVTIFGAGAIGGFLGTRLLQSGCEVAAVARGATASALRAHGWRLRTGNSTVAMPARVGERPSEAASQELGLIAGNGPALAGVAAAVAPLPDR